MLAQVKDKWLEWAPRKWQASPIEAVSLHALHQGMWDVSTVPWLVIVISYIECSYRVQEQV